MTDHPQFATGGDGGILLPQRPRRTVTRVREGRLAVLDERGIQRLEVVETEEDLAPHLQNVGHRMVVARRKSFGDIVNRARVVRHVLAGAAVTTGRGADQAAVAIDQGQRDAVDLELAEERNVGTGVGMDAARPELELLGAEHVVQRQHSLQMVRGGEIRREAGAADELGRRVGRAQFGMFVLERGETTQQHVEVRVGDDRRIADVVAELVFAHLVGKFTPGAAYLGRDGIVLG